MKKVIVFIVLALFLNTATVFAATNTNGEKYWGKKNDGAYVVYPQADTTDTRTAYCFDKHQASPGNTEIDYTLIYPDATADQLLLSNTSINDYMTNTGYTKEQVYNIISNMILIGASYNGTINGVDTGFYSMAQKAAVADGRYEDDAMYYYRTATQNAIWSITDSKTYTMSTSDGSVYDLETAIQQAAVAHRDENLAANAGLDLKLDIYTTTQTTTVGSETKLYQTLISSRLEPNSVEVEIKASKTLDGTASAKQFTFGLYLEGNDDPVATVQNDTDGKITFELTFDTEGTFNYTMKEIEDATDTGINYDGTSYPVTVTISKDATNTLVGQVSYDGGTTEPTFANTTNTTMRSEVIGLIQGNKTFNGEASTKQFTFELYEDGNTEAIATTQNSTTDGTLTFTMSYPDPGVYTYVIKEVAGTDSTIAYDENEYPIRVVVNDYDYDTFSGTSYYSYKAGEFEYYIKENEPGVYFPVYPIANNKVEPSTSTDKTVNTTQYTVYANPDNDTLSKYVGDNVFGDELAENMRKIAYYYDINPTLDVNNKKSIMNIATNSNYYRAGKAMLDEILDATIVPDNYEFYLFVPDDTTKAPLIGGSGATINYSDDLNFRVNYPVMVPVTISNSSKTTINLKANKYLDNQLLTEDHDFSFTLYKSDSTWTVGDAIMTVKNDGSTISFDNVATVTYDDVGTTFYFVAKENADSTYDIDAELKKYKVEVQMNEGVLETVVTVDGTASDTANFYNTTKFIVPTGVKEGNSVVFGSLLAGGIVLLVLLKKFNQE